MGIIEPLNEHSFNLITTGLSLGLLHVLAGPDHLSALAALSVGSSWRAFTLGFRWGIGHSTGLVVVAIIFISLKGELDLRTMGRYCDLLVGLFMIALGCYGVLGAIKMYREKHNKRDRDLVHDESSNNKKGTAAKAVTSKSAMAKTTSLAELRGRQRSGSQLLAKRYTNRRGRRVQTHK